MSGPITLDDVIEKCLSRHKFLRLTHNEFRSIVNEFSAQIGRNYAVNAGTNLNPQMTFGFSASGSPCARFTTSFVKQYGLTHDADSYIVERGAFRTFNYSALSVAIPRSSTGVDLRNLILFFFQELGNYIRQNVTVSFVFPGLCRIITFPSVRTYKIEFDPGLVAAVRSQRLPEWSSQRLLINRDLSRADIREETVQQPHLYTSPINLQLSDKSVRFTQNPYSSQNDVNYTLLNRSAAVRVNMFHPDFIGSAGDPLYGSKSFSGEALHDYLRTTNRYKSKDKSNNNGDASAVPIYDEKMGSKYVIRPLGKSQQIRPSSAGPVMSTNNRIKSDLNNTNNNDNLRNMNSTIDNNTNNGAANVGENNGNGNTKVINMNNSLTTNNNNNNNNNNNDNSNNNNMDNIKRPSSSRPGSARPAIANRNLQMDTDNVKYVGLSPRQERPKSAMAGRQTSVAASIKRTPEYVEELSRSLCKTFNPPLRNSVEYGRVYSTVYANELEKAKKQFMEQKDANVERCKKALRAALALNQAKLCAPCFYKQDMENKARLEKEKREDEKKNYTKFATSEKAAYDEIERLAHERSRRNAEDVHKFNRTVADEHWDFFCKRRADGFFQTDPNVLRENAYVLKEHEEQDLERARDHARMLKEDAEIRRALAEKKLAEAKLLEAQEMSKLKDIDEMSKKLDEVHKMATIKSQKEVLDKQLLEQRERMPSRESMGYCFGDAKAVDKTEKEAELARITMRSALDDLKEKQRLREERLNREKQSGIDERDRITADLIAERDNERKRRLNEIAQNQKNYAITDRERRALKEAEELERKEKPTGWFFEDGQWHKPCGCTEKEMCEKCGLNPVMSF